jgi:adenylylsulfate kinase
MNNLTRQKYSINRIDRNQLNKHSSFLIWFTGLSGSGKSTLANLLEMELSKHGIHTYLLDGDNVRLGLNKDLSFSGVDRTENIRRIGEVANLMIDAGLVTIAAFISPFQADRENVKKSVGESNYIEIYVDTPLEECMKRDTKGLYEKAIKGEILNLTGISSPYEIPESPNLIVNTSEITNDIAVDKIVNLVMEKLKQND